MQRKWIKVSRRDRLRRLVDLARVYRRWTRQQVADALGREASKLVPESGNPKLDLVMALSSAMDWEPGQVAQCVWQGGDAAQGDGGACGRDAAELETEACLAERAREWGRLSALARAMHERAEVGAARAEASHRLAVACAGQGRYTDTLRHAQSGLSETGVPPAVQRLLMSDLAAAHDALGHLVESHAVATQLLSMLRDSAGEAESRQAAFAFWVRGNASCRRIDADPSRSHTHAADASADLHAARAACQRIAHGDADLSIEALARRCEGALLECSVAMGATAPADAIRSVETALDAVVDVDSYPAGPWLESHGWWAVAGCGIALRALSGAELQRAMAIFTNKASEIAERVDSWTLRERAFALEHLRRGRASDEAGIAPEWLLDRDDLRMITGTMGRFPAFREVGLEILETAKLLEPV